MSTLSSTTAEELPVQRQEVPTHLNIEAKSFAGRGTAGAQRRPSWLEGLFTFW